MSHYMWETYQKIPGDKKYYFNDFLKSSNDEVISNCQHKRLEKNQELISLDDHVGKVILLLSGVVKALDSDASGEVFIFRRFDAPAVFGEVEIFAELEEYRASLFSETVCDIFIIDADKYAKFVKENSEFMFLRLKAISQLAVNDAKESRTFLRMSGIERIKSYLFEQYKLQNTNQLTLNKARSDIANETGLSIRTIQRCLNKLRNEGLINLKGNTIIVNKDQATSLYKHLEDYY